LNLKNFLKNRGLQREFEVYNAQLLTDQGSLERLAKAAFQRSVLRRFLEPLRRFEKVSKNAC
ncbi:hypothetical protein, partial [Marinimicrobium alkaliphilum]|uniref:hypothetical protein n=1 Tax=Marinimicrobium alkaliphilum TaxID=2202654 RepID=UPI001E641079